MLEDIRKVISYILDLSKNSISRVFFLLDIVGVALIIFTDLEITVTHLVFLFAIGLIVSNYKIYADNLPGLSMSTSLLNKSPFRIIHADNQSIHFNACYNLYINNDGNVTGVIENINVELVKFCNFNDEYLTNKIGVKFKGCFISDEKTFAPITYIKNQAETKYPIIINSKQIITKVLTLEICISESSEENYLKTLEWINDIEFKIITNVKYNNTDQQQVIKQFVYKKDIEQRGKEFLKNLENSDDIFR